MSGQGTGPDRLAPGPDVALRPPETVMRLARLGSFHATRLSFMRSLLRRLKADDWRFDRPLWRVDARGEGIAVYRARGPTHTYTLVAFAHDLPPEKRSDRVIAEAWDATFVLHDGEVTEADIARLATHVPVQEAGRFSAAEIVLSRANKSVRLFDHVVGTLAAGCQPDPVELDRVGYLMRTTAVYGGGKFGLADRERVAGRPELAGPFQAEMLAVWLIRAFTIDLAEHMAAAQAPERAVHLNPDLRRRLGVGNATGLGMAPFIVNHPALLDRWIRARETALARVRSLARADGRAIAVFGDALERAQAMAAVWQVPDPVQSGRVAGLQADLVRLAAQARLIGPDSQQPWDGLYRWAEATLDLEAQEMLVSLLLEPYGALVDDLVETMAGDELAEFRIDGAMSIGDLCALAGEHYRFALAIDFANPAAEARFWYMSEEKLEPRLGERHLEPGADREQPLTAARDVAALYRALGGWDPLRPVAEFLLSTPEFRHTVRRVQIAARRPYAEIRDNLIDERLRPIDLLRCKLSFFGATRFDPKSDRWVRITMYQFAPLPDELPCMPADDWCLPPVAALRP